MVIRDRVFISYSNLDEKWERMLRKKLKPLEIKGLKVWSDKDIMPGQEWLVEINNFVKQTKVAVLLVSDNFLNSDFIREQELPRFLEPARLKQLTILPVLISDCLWEETEIVKFQSPFDPKQPLNGLVEHELDEALVQIARAIKEAWEKPVGSLSQPEVEASKAALEAFRLLADQHAAMTADSVDACFRRAVSESSPQASLLQDLFPQLNTAQSLGWPQLSAFFEDSNRPATALVQALENQLLNQNLQQHPDNQYNRGSQGNELIDPLPADAALDTGGALGASDLPEAVSKLGDWGSLHAQLHQAILNGLGTVDPQATWVRYKAEISRDSYSIDGEVLNGRDVLSHLTPGSLDREIQQIIDICSDFDDAFVLLRNACKIFRSSFYRREFESSLLAYAKELPNQQACTRW